MSATQAVNRAGLALVEKADADSAIEDELTDEQWDETLTASHVISGVTREVSGRPELIARTVLAALDVEELAQVLKAHRRDGRKSWAPRVVCVCGWVGESVDHETHIAAALHVALLGTDQ